MINTVFEVVCPEVSRMLQEEVSRGNFHPASVDAILWTVLGLLSPLLFFGYCGIYWMNIKFRGKRELLIELSKLDAEDLQKVPSRRERWCHRICFEDSFLSEEWDDGKWNHERCAMGVVYLSKTMVQTPEVGAYEKLVATFGSGDPK
jgi:hypothetical protein